MANQILHKSSTTAGKAPAPADLVLREIAINTTDGFLYIKKSNGQVIVVNPPQTIPTPLTATVNVGDMPVSSFSFLVNTTASVGQKIVCSVSGDLDNGEFIDALELEPLIVFGKVIQTNMIQFVITTVNAEGIFTGTRSVNYYLG